MKVLIGILFLSFFCLKVNCQSVKIFSEENISITRYSTFRVDKGEVVTHADQNFDEDLFFGMIKGAITEELRKKGYLPIQDSSANLIISYIGQMTVIRDVEDLGPLGKQPADKAIEMDRDQQWSREYQESTLVIEATDPLLKKVVWRATSTLDQGSLMNEQALNMMVLRSFRKFKKQKK